MWWLKLQANLKQAWYNVTGRRNEHARIRPRNPLKSGATEVGARTAGRRPNPNPRQKTTVSNNPEQKNDPEPKMPELPTLATVEMKEEESIPEIDKRKVPAGTSV